MEQEAIVEIRAVVPRAAELRFAAPVDWRIEAGQQWAIIGPNGAGKSLLADMLQRRVAMQQGEVVYPKGVAWMSHIKSITFRDIYSLADLRTTYYQQRWHATESDDMPTVRELLRPFAAQPRMMELLTHFGIADLLPKRLIMLSSGELRKFLIVRALMSRPRVLVLDNPFIGLDANARELLQETLADVATLEGVQVVLLLANPADIPPMITQVQPVLDRSLLPPMSRADFLADKALIGLLFPTEAEDWELPVAELPLDEEREPSLHEVTLRMEKIHVQYGDRTILHDLDWEVRNGEKWALFGPNGSGKSTLLSLVCADNPQSYANTFYLFDRKRGSGETIWEIKRRIGYVSPEMHLYYKDNMTTLRMVAMGCLDTVGNYRTPDAEQEATAMRWMRVFGIAHLAERLFQTLSSGEQRLAMLARSFVKDPDLIVLDEPLHGLDVSNKKLAAAIIERFCARPGKTLIYVTHYPHELPASVDKQLTLKRIP